MLVFILAAGAASANLLSFRLSYFVPHLKGDFWDIEFENMAFKNRASMTSRSASSTKPS